MLSPAVKFALLDPCVAYTLVNIRLHAAWQILSYVIRQYLAGYEEAE